MFSAPPVSHSPAATRAGHHRRWTCCVWGLALAIFATISTVASAGGPYAAASGSRSEVFGFEQAAAEDHAAAPTMAASADHEVDAAIEAAPSAESRSAGATAGGDTAADAQDPLSRLRLPSSASQFDPAQTLKDWAEGAGLLIAFGIVSLWLVRQWVTRQDGAGGPTAHLRTIESLSLPQRCRIHLVDVDGRQVLVAVDASGIKSVTPLPDRFAALLEGADGSSQPAGAQPAERDATRHDAWNARQETRLT